MSLIATTKRAIAKMAEYDIAHHASMLKWTTIIIWTSSMLAEVATFAYNKKLPPKEKHFIIRQELVAGSISLAITLFLAHRTEKFGEYLVEKAKFLPKAFPKEWRTPEIIEKILKKDVDFIRTHMTTDAAKVWLEKLPAFRGGMNVTTGTIGSIVGFNLITPLISNKIASYYHNKGLAHHQKAAEPLTKHSARDLTHDSQVGLVPGKKLDKKEDVAPTAVNSFATYPVWRGTQGTRPHKAAPALFAGSYNGVISR